jgi:hypothetical protein
MHRTDLESILARICLLASHCLGHAVREELLCSLLRAHFMEVERVHVPCECIHVYA